MKSPERREVPREFLVALERLGVPFAELRVERSLWAGYGTLFRGALPSGERLVAKLVLARPPSDDAIGHHRKLESYRVEGRYYERYPDLSNRFGAACYASLHAGDSSLLVLRDLEDLGFTEARSARGAGSTRAVLDLLANFHATTLGKPPTWLWPIGTYYHLSTRPREYAAMPSGGLKNAAAKIDEKLRGARYRCWVHGDAKPENFCFSGDGKAKAVDFQYVGGGSGIVDVAYFLSSVLPANASTERIEPLLNDYFAFLRKHLDALPPESRLSRTEKDALETEWRHLHPLAWADLYRFLAGWAPGSYDDEPLANALIARALDELG